MVKIGAVVRVPGAFQQVPGLADPLQLEQAYFWWGGSSGIQGAIISRLTLI